MTTTIRVCICIALLLTVLVNVAKHTNGARIVNGPTKSHESTQTPIPIPSFLENFQLNALFESFQQNHSQTQEITFSGLVQRFLRIINRLLDKMQSLSEGGLLDTVVTVNRVFASVNRMLNGEDWRKQMHEIHSALPGQDFLKELGILPEGFELPKFSLEDLGFL